MLNTDPRAGDSRRLIRLACLGVLGVLLALGFVACGDDEAEDGSAQTAEEQTCEDVSKPAPKDVDLKRPPAKPSAQNLTAVVETSCGTFEIALDTRRNPRTAASFAYLAENGVYDGTWFHRIVPGFVIQGGDPQANGSGGPGYSVDERPPSNAAYTRGVVAMAKTEAEPPGRSGSQFFVVTAPDAGLPAQYAIAGEVTEGLDVVQTIEQFGDPATGGAGAPLDEVLIESVTIERG